MKYGNCIIGAVILLWTKRHEDAELVFKNRIGSIVPHFMVKTKHQVYHYKTEKDILPWPLCYILFQGSFHSVSLNKFKVN